VFVQSTLLVKFIIPAFIHVPSWPLLPENTPLQRCVALVNVLSSYIEFYETGKYPVFSSSGLNSTADPPSVEEVTIIPEVEEPVFYSYINDTSGAMYSDLSVPAHPSLVSSLLFGTILNEGDAWVKYIYGVILGFCSFGLIYGLFCFCKFVRLYLGCNWNPTPQLYLSWIYKRLSNSSSKRSLPAIDNM